MIIRTFSRDLLTTAEAVYSDCELYRYRLVIEWDATIRPAMVIGLNPSTATERDNDNTITRLERWARRNGYGALWMFNAYGLRSTDPNGLWEVDDPVGEGNDDLISAAFETGMVPVLAWGNNITDEREIRLLELWEACRNFNPKWTAEPPHYPRCFKVTKEGHPWHPLYLSDKALDAVRDFMP